MTDGTRSNDANSNVEVVLIQHLRTMLDENTDTYIGRADPDGEIGALRLRALDASLGRWTRPDPLGYGDGVNRSEALSSSPLNLLDPLGLRVQDPATRPGSAFDGTTTLPDGATAKVAVRPGISYTDQNGGKHENVIVFTIDTPDGSCDECHFLQFVKTYVDFPDGATGGNGYEKIQAGVFRKWGDWYLDALRKHPLTPWYDLHGAHVRTPRSLSIADRPEMGSTLPPGTVAGMEFRTYLVCDGKVLWMWEWRTRQEANADEGWTDPSYEVQSARPANDLGDFDGMDDFPVGQREPEEGARPVPGMPNPLR